MKVPLLQTCRIGLLTTLLGASFPEAGLAGLTGIGSDGPLGGVLLQGSRDPNCVPHFIDSPGKQPRGLSGANRVRVDALEWDCRRREQFRPSRRRRKPHGSTKDSFRRERNQSG